MIICSRTKQTDFQNCIQRSCLNSRISGRSPGTRGLPVWPTGSGGDSHAPPESTKRSSGWRSLLFQRTKPLARPAPAERWQACQVTRIAVTYALLVSIMTIYCSHRIKWPRHGADTFPRRGANSFAYQVGHLQVVLVARRAVELPYYPQSSLEFTFTGDCNCKLGPGSEQAIRWQAYVVIECPAPFHQTVSIKALQDSVIHGRQRPLLEGARWNQSKRSLLKTNYLLIMQDLSLGKHNTTLME